MRAGLAPRWRCIFANDVDPVKASIYSANWGHHCLQIEDVHALTAKDLPGRADLAWASFPCQDLSCAGNGLGLGNARGKLKTRSGTFLAVHRAYAGIEGSGARAENHRD